MRIGHGYDVHRFAENRRLVLGGVEIPYEKGLLGHSDADVLVHALMDSLLGALALGDIGRHFPDTSGEFKDIDSMILLSKVCDMIKQNGYELCNADCTVIAQAPKLLPHIYTMRQNIAKVMQCDISCINVKATTEEKLGFTGRLEGISAHAVCLLRRINA